MKWFNDIFTDKVMAIVCLFCAGLACAGLNWEVAGLDLALAMLFHRCHLLSR